MSTSPYKKLDKLNINFRKKVERFLNEVNKNGKVIFVTETWRSEKRQAMLRKKWLSKVKISNHQKGLAIDIAFYWKVLYPKNHTKRENVAKIARKHWIHWGFDLWKWDKPHFQDNLDTYLEPMKTPYKDLYKKKIWENPNYKNIFNSHDWDKPLTESETKYLIEIAMMNLKKQLNFPILTKIIDKLSRFFK